MAAAGLFTKRPDRNYLWDETFKKKMQQDCTRLDGGCRQHEIYHDCTPCEHDDCAGILQQQLQIFEVINHIRNAREFKGLLSHMAYTSNMLYRTFRQAYSKARKNKHKKRKRNYMTSVGMHPRDIINIEVPVSNQEYFQDVRDEHPPAETQTNHANTNCPKSLKKHICSCPKFEEKVPYGRCPICLGVVEPKRSTCCEKCGKKLLETDNDKKFEYETENVQNEIPANATDTYICQPFGDELQQLIFCERCAVLRGETVEATKEPKCIENLTDTFHDVSNTESLSNSNTPKQVLNLSPVCVNIPLKLQIGGQHVQSCCIETEIQMKAFADTQSESSTCIQRPAEVPKETSPTHAKCQPPHVASKQIEPDKLKNKSASDTFYSCPSDSDLIKFRDKPEGCNNNALIEILEMMKKQMPSFKEPAAAKEMQSRGVQISPSEDPAMPAPTAPPSKTNFTQTVENMQTTSELSTVASPPTFDPDLKGQQLRSNLLAEVRAVLDKTTTKDALKALQEGKRFSLPTNLMQNETPNLKPARHSAPSTYMAMPKRAASLQSYSPLPFTTRSDTLRKPELFPKPVIAPKPLPSTAPPIQTRSSTPTATGHSKRSEIRNEIQDDLKELSQRNPPKPHSNYKPEEKDEILLDLHKLFHPDDAGKSSKNITLEDTLQDIRYLLATEEHQTDAVTSRSSTQSPQPAESRDSILQSIKHILNPKSSRKPANRKKYSKETKSKILENLQNLITPRSQKEPTTREIRDSIVEDLRYMLNTEHETSGANLPSLQQPTATGASTSETRQLRQERQEKPRNEIRDSIIRDFKFLLDIPQSNRDNKTFEENLATARQLTNRHKSDSSSDSLADLADRK